MKENLDIPAFMQHVRERGFDIEDQGWIHSVIRRFVISKGDFKNYLDIDKENMIQDRLLFQANSFMDNIERKETHDKQKD